jgi:hypothetical protein
VQSHPSTGASTTKIVIFTLPSRNLENIILIADGWNVSRAAQFDASRSRTNEDLQRDLDEWLHDYNYERTHQGKMCCGRTPMQTLIYEKEAWHDKIATLNN